MQGDNTTELTLARAKLTPDDAGFVVVTISLLADQGLGADFLLIA